MKFYEVVSDECNGTLNPLSINSKSLSSEKFLENNEVEIFCKYAHHVLINTKFPRTLFNSYRGVALAKWFSTVSLVANHIYMNNNNKNNGVGIICDNAHLHIVSLIQVLRNSVQRFKRSCAE